MTGSFFQFYFHYLPFSFIAGVIIDAIVGDPHWMPHPVRLIGKVIRLLEGWLYPEGTDASNEQNKTTDSRQFEDKAEEHKDSFNIKKVNGRIRRRGVLLVIYVLLFTFLWSVMTLFLCFLIHRYCLLAGMCVLAAYTIAAKDLRVESLRVVKALEEDMTSGPSTGSGTESDTSTASGSGAGFSTSAGTKAGASTGFGTGADSSKGAANEPDAARRALSMIVGRDTDRLDEAGILRAVIETIAEGSCDGVVAPMLYLAIGGPVLALLYKAVNTMDSMIGYRNARYRDFGTAAARLDDVLNCLPARMAAGGILLFGILHDRNAAGQEIGNDDGKDTEKDDKKGTVSAWHIFLRDRNKTDSPNAGQTEAAMAGVLGVQLGGPASYQGVVHEKAFLGEDSRPVTREDVRRALRGLMVLTALWALLLGSVTIINGN